MRNIVILNSLHFSYPLPILMRVSYNTLIVKQNTSDYYKYTDYLRGTPTLYRFSLFRTQIKQIIQIYTYNKTSVQSVRSVFVILLLYAPTKTTDPYRVTPNSSDTTRRVFGHLPLFPLYESSRGSGVCSRLSVCAWSRLAW